MDNKCYNNFILGIKLKIDHDAEVLLLQILTTFHWSCLTTSSLESTLYLYKCKSKRTVITNGNKMNINTKFFFFVVQLSQTVWIFSYWKKPCTVPFLNYRSAKTEF